MIGLLALAVAVSGLFAPAARVERSRALMGTLCVAAARADSGRGAAAIDAAFDEIARLDTVMSSWTAGSELARWNSLAGTAAPCSPELFAVLDSAAAIASATAGAFDPTIEPLLRAWDLRGRGRRPTAAERRTALARVGWSRLRFDRAAGTVTADPGMAVDLGGIGKGFALDRAAAAAGSRGATDLLINFGGEILAHGDDPDGAPGAGWEIAIADPADRLRPAAALRIRDLAVSTSGQSERAVRVGGKVYGHVVDPRAGVPRRTRASVTVVAATATRADALATAFLVLGREATAAWARHHPAVGVIWLEPGRGRVRIWTWNVREVSAAPGVRLEWRTASAGSASSNPSRP